jgi:hypothetical protein
MSKYNNALAFKHGLAPVATSEGWGVVNREGQEVNGVIKGLENGTSFALTPTGQLLWREAN